MGEESGINLINLDISKMKRKMKSIREIIKEIKEENGLKDSENLSAKLEVELQRKMSFEVLKNNFDNDYIIFKRFCNYLDDKNLEKFFRLSKFYYLWC